MVVEVSSSVWMVVLPFRAKRTVDVPAIAPIEVWTPRRRDRKQHLPGDRQEGVVDRKQPADGKVEAVVEDGQAGGAVEGRAGVLPIPDLLGIDVDQPLIRCLRRQRRE
jgi:hypothetical protein